MARTARLRLLLAVALAVASPSAPGCGELSQDSATPPAQTQPAAPSTPPAPGADGAPAAESPPAPRRNLLVYLIDGLGAADLPAFGHSRETMPGLATIMDQGITFLNFYTVSPWTAPATASLLTSLYPSTHTVERAGDRLPSDAKTMAEALRSRGYKTALFSAHPLVGPLSGLDSGFDWVEEIQGAFTPKTPTGPSETSATLNRRVLDWIDKNAANSPWFVVALSADPLLPFGAPEPEGGRFIDPPERKWYAGVRSKLLVTRPGPLALPTPGDLKRLKVDPARFIEDARKIHDGAIFYNDGQLGLLREALQDRKLLSSMLFVVTSTHGEEWLQRGMLGHGASLYDTAIHVPLVMTCPEMFPRAGQIRRRSDGVDLMPTIFSALEVAVPEGAQGVDRLTEPTVETKLFLDRAVYAEARPAGSLPTGTLSMTEYGDSKFILNEENPAGMDRQDVELYRRTGTPDWELTNRAGSFPRIMATRRENLERWKQKTRASRLPTDTPPPPPDPRLKEVLRSLGYLQGMGSGAAAPVASTKKDPAKPAPSASSGAKP